MPAHPPWLRFQAYVVGLPKTGSTSLATIFGNYRSGHEWQLMELLAPALARRKGELSDEDFLLATGKRLLPVSLEMDSTTCHHLYTDLLLARFPHAVFLHTVRDVRSWATSLLDMTLRKRLAGRIIKIEYTASGLAYFRLMTGGAYDFDPGYSGDDRTSLIPLMRYWAAHMGEMSRLLPAERSLRLRARDIRNSLPEIARLTGVPVATLRADLAHANQAPLRFDRFSAFDCAELREAYNEYCAEIMADIFPEEHAAWLAHCAEDRHSGVEALDWETYLAAVEAWVTDAVRRYGPSAAH